jgi:hypothetical protein
MFEEEKEFIYDEFLSADEMYNISEENKNKRRKCRKKYAINQVSDAIKETTVRGHFECGFPELITHLSDDERETRLYIYHLLKQRGYKLKMKTERMHGLSPGKESELYYRKNVYITWGKK